MGLKNFFSLSTPKAKSKLSMKDIQSVVKNVLNDFITDNNIPPDIISVVISCTYLEFSDILKRAFYGAVEALYEIARETVHCSFPTIDVSLSVGLEPLRDEGRMKVRVRCINQIAPNIIPDKDATETSVDYQSIEPYFSKEKLHFMAREYNPETNEMKIRWQFNKRGRTISDATFKVAISNPGVRFEENHSAEYYLYGNADLLTICGMTTTGVYGMTNSMLHVDSIDFPGTLLGIRYNQRKGVWEYKIFSENTIIRGEPAAVSDNHWAFDEPLTITVEGVGLYLEPPGYPRRR